jgi:hypothetical protein
MKSLKTDIDDLFKNDDWYVLNNWDKYLNMSDTEDELSTQTWSKLISNSTRVLIFDNIEDEANISSDTLDITGKFGDETIVKITMNGKEAKINSENKTFKFEWIDTNAQQNDLVFRAYDDAGDVLEKKLITVYYNAADKITTGWSSFGNVKTYNDVDASQFTFTEPSNFTTFSTKSGEVTIKGKVFNKDVASVNINWYQLNSYSKNIWTWRYYAFEKFNTIGNGTNVYTVKYYDINNKLIYTNNYTIVKKTDQPIKKDPIISDEANITN